MPETITPMRSVDLRWNAAPQFSYMRDFKIYDGDVDISISFKSYKVGGFRADFGYEQFPERKKHGMEGLHLYAKVVVETSNLVNQISRRCCKLQTQKCVLRCVLHV